MRSPIMIGVSVLMMGAAIAGCARRERITIVTPPPAPVAAGPTIVAAPPPAVVATPAPTGTVVITDTPRFREYVLAQRVPSYTFQGEIIVGAMLPPAGVTYYEVPPQFAMTQYRYALVNNRMVLVDPVTHRIVQIIG